MFTVWMPNPETPWLVSDPIWPPPPPGVIAALDTLEHLFGSWSGV